MKMSQDINELALAISGMQSQLSDVYKSSKGFGYTYADLSSILEYIRPILSKYGLSVVQPIGGGDGIVSVTTILMHSSGQFISETINTAIDITTKKMNSLQAAGSTITYLRRYSLSAILGLSSTDDDGKSGGDHIDDSAIEIRAGLISSISRTLDVDANKEIAQKALEHYKASSIELLTVSQLQALLARINKID
jgi:hypothetical protein